MSSEKECGNSLLLCKKLSFSFVHLLILLYISTTLLANVYAAYQNKCRKLLFILSKNIFKNLYLLYAYICLFTNKSKHLQANPKIISISIFLNYC